MRQVDEDELDFPSEFQAFLNGEPFTGQAIEYEEGKPVELATFVDGLENGQRLSWSSGGQLLAQGNISYPYNAVGPWHFWDEAGNLIRENIFDAKGNIRVIREWDESGTLIGEERHDPLWGNKDQATDENTPLRWR